MSVFCLQKTLLIVLFGLYSAFIAEDKIFMFAFFQIAAYYKKKIVMHGYSDSDTPYNSFWFVLNIEYPGETIFLIFGTQIPVSNKCGHLT